jgi:hypothetical protein
MLFRTANGFHFPELRFDYFDGIAMSLVSVIDFPSVLT